MARRLGTGHVPGRLAGAGVARSGGRVAVLRDRDFARFFAGYATSLLGTSMSALAVSFAVLDNGGTASDLGAVLAAGIVPQVLFMLGGGVIADRLGRRPVMLGADIARCGAQAALAGAVLAGHPALWVFILLAVARGTGDAVFTPALTGLTAELAPPGRSGQRQRPAHRGPVRGRGRRPRAGWASWSRWPAPEPSSPWTRARTGSACWRSRRSGCRPPGPPAPVPPVPPPGPVPPPATTTPPGPVPLVSRPPWPGPTSLICATAGLSSGAGPGW